MSDQLFARFRNLSVKSASQDARGSNGTGEAAVASASAPSGHSRSGGHVTDDDKDDDSPHADWTRRRRPPATVSSGASPSTSSAATTTTVSARKDEGLDIFDEQFDSWSREEQTAFVISLVTRLDYDQLVSINAKVEPLLHRDFVTQLPDELVLKIFSFCDRDTLVISAQVCRDWHRILQDNAAWRLLYQRERDWPQPVALPTFARPIVPMPPELRRPLAWKRLYVNQYLQRRETLANWRTGNYHVTSTIQCRSLGIYTVQYNDEIIASGHRDHIIRIWSRSQARAGAPNPLVRQLEGHSGSVLSLQFRGDLIVSGSSDNSICIWNMKTGRLLSTLQGHTHPVLHLNMDDETIVSCSKDTTVRVWRIRRSPETNEVIGARQVSCFMGHRAAVNAVEFQGSTIVSASGDRTLKVWDMNAEPDTACLRTLSGHTRGIACVHYQGDHVVSGSSDRLIKMWRVSTGECLLTLAGHTDLVRCIRFNEQYIVSGSYDRSIRVWDRQSGKPLYTMEGHEHRVLRVQFDQSQICSCSQDDRIVVWSFAPEAQSLSRFFPPSELPSPLSTTV